MKRAAFHWVLVLALLLSYSAGLPFGQKSLPTTRDSVFDTGISPYLQALITANPLRPQPVIVQTVNLPTLNLLSSIRLTVIAPSGSVLSTRRAVVEWRSVGGWRLRFGQYHGAGGDRRTVCLNHRRQRAVYDAY